MPTPTAFLAVTLNRHLRYVLVSCCFFPIQSSHEQCNRGLQEDLLEEFYSRLGSPLLSTLVKEEYKVAGIPQSNTERARGLRHLVLERLALFLSERNRSSSDLTLEHLKQEGNFQVLETQSVNLRRTFKHGQMERTNLQEISAAAIKARGNVVSLYLSRSVELDMYE